MARPRRPAAGLLVSAAAAVCLAAVQGYPCGSPGRPLHGSVSPSSQLFYAGENVTITCQEGYVRFGQPTRTCTQDGTWAGVMPFCRRNVAYLGSTQGPQVSLAGGPTRGEPRLATDGDMLSCSVSPRDVRERWWQVRLRSPTRVESVGLVVPPGSVLDLSVFVISLDTPQPNDAVYQPCANFSGTLQDAKRLFYCGGQGLVGEYVYIRDDRPFQDYLTLCEVEVFAFADVRDCGEPEWPAHGIVTRPDADTATYSCQSGYHLAGRVQRRCNRGEWTGQQPVCRKIFCERPPPLENGYLEGRAASRVRHAYNTSVQYRCDAGFVMHGGPGRRTCTAAGRWSAAMPLCQPLVCPMPAKFPNSVYELLNGTTRWMATVEYSCRDGFVLGPDSERPVTVCEDHGHWRPVNFSCVTAALVAPSEEPPDEASGAADGELTVTPEHHEAAMSSGVIVGLLVGAIIAIAAMIIVGICFKRRVWQRRKERPSAADPAVPTDVKTYDQVYEPSYQNVLSSGASTMSGSTLSTFRPAGQTEPPLGRPVQPPFETLQRRLAAGGGGGGQEPDDCYEPVAGGRVYDAVAGETDGPYASLRAGADREPDYETLRAARTEEGHYDLVPPRASPAYQVYDQVPSSNYENCRLAPAAPAQVPDLLKGASSSPDIPPEILALYAKVIKSKKRHPGDGEPPLPPPPAAEPDSACPSSPGSSAASSYTRDLIDKFNRLASREEEAAGAAAGTLERQGTQPAEERVQYTQVCPPAEGQVPRRPAVDPVVYSAVRPLPPVPPDA